MHAQLIYLFMRMDVYSFKKLCLNSGPGRRINPVTATPSPSHPARTRMKNPAYTLLATAILGAMDIVFGEVDR